MLKRSLLFLLALAACDGGGGGGGNPYPPISLNSVAGETFVSEGPRMTTLDGFTPATQTASTIQFASASQITLNGVVLTRDATGNTFRSGDGTVTLTVETGITGVQTDQILYMLATQDQGGTTSLQPLVAGNLTAASDLPQTGQAIYSGTMVLYNDLGQPLTMAGPAFFVDLNSAVLSGSLTFASEYVEIVPTTMVGGSFATTLTSLETVPTVEGSIDGAFFGATGQEIGGTLILTYAPGGIPTETYVGYYGAEQIQ